MTARKKSVKKRSARKKAYKKKSVKKATKKKISIPRTPSGYINRRSIIVPADIATSKPVPTSKIKAGFDRAKKEIDGFIQDLVDTLSESYSIKEIELMASFDAEGKFLGFGIGGAASIKIVIAPDQ